MNECVEMGTERGEVGAQPSHRKRSICQSAFKTKGNIKTKILQCLWINAPSHDTTFIQKQYNRINKCHIQRRVFLLFTPEYKEMEKKRVSRYYLMHGQSSVHCHA